MLEAAYVINKEKSFSTNFVVIDLIEATRELTGLKLSPLKKILSIIKWQDLSNAKDVEAQKILQLKDCFFENGSLHISIKQTIQAIKFLATTGKLYFNNKQLACDFFSKNTFFYQVSEEKTVKGMIDTGKEIIELQSCDFIFNGTSCFFIKGVFFKIISNEVSYKDLKELFLTPEKFSLKDLIECHDEDCPSIIYEGNSKLSLELANDPLPILKLRDRTGGFADLIIDYGNNRLIDIHDPIKSKMRQLDKEKAIENDLLETGFKAKWSGSSHYYCPLNEVYKSLVFLLEVGWTILDSKGAKVLAGTPLHYQTTTNNETISIKGKIDFKDYQASLKDITGAFNKKEHFVLLAHDTVGLLPDLNHLTPIFEEASIENDVLVLPKNRFGTLEKLFENRTENVFDEGMLKLKEFYSVDIIESINPTSQFLSTLRPYQQVGLNWLHFLYKFGFNGILADDMGLGKTVQTLAFLSLIPRKLPILIVCPNSLLFNWKNEIEKFLKDEKVIIYHGVNRQLPKDYLNAIILTSYATMRIDQLFLSTLDFSAIVLDEAQNIKNSDSQVAKSAYTLKAPFKLLLTGTPIENHLGELWSLFRFLMPDLLQDKKSFEIEVLNHQLTTIKQKIKPFILRRKKQFVAKDLPDLIEQTVLVDMSDAQRNLYEGFLANMKQSLFSKIDASNIKKHKLEIFEAILRLRQICCHPLLASAYLPENAAFESSKLETLMEDIENIIEEQGKVIVYSQFTSMLNLISEKLIAKNLKFTRLDGSTKDREKVVTQFQEDAETQVFLISLKAGGVGLNLTKADYVLIFDPWWNEAAELQAINRAHRLGRTSTVVAKRYVMRETIEEKIMKLKEKKKAIIDYLFDDGMAFDEFNIDDLEFLLS